MTGPYLHLPVVDPLLGRCTGDTNTPWRPLWCHLEFGHVGDHAWTTIPPVLERVPAGLEALS